MLKIQAFRWITGAALFAGSVALASAQTPVTAPASPRAPGVVRGVEHPDTTPVGQTQPDDKQPETATDTTPGETARDDQKTAPETATDAPKSPATQKPAADAAHGVRSNAAQPSKPQH